VIDGLLQRRPGIIARMSRAFGSGFRVAAAALLAATLGCTPEGAEGPPPRSPSANASNPAPLTFVRGSLACGDRHACAIASGAVLCWGLDEDGQLGDGAKAPQPKPVQAIAAAAGEAKFLAAGEGHSCALVNDAVLCFGDNSSGECGVPGTCATCVGPDVDVPTKVPGLGAVQAIAAGGDHSCAIVGDDAGLRCWGSNEHGQLGLGAPDGQPHPVPQAVPGLSGVKEVALGTAHTCARLRDGTIWCFGANELGELGDGTFVDRAKPAQVPGIRPARGVAAGYAGSCAVFEDGTARCWGKTDVRVGDSKAKHGRAIPASVDGVLDVQSIDVGADRTCALHTDGTVSCWANQTERAVEDPKIGSITGATKVDGLDRVRELSVGMQHACARLMSDQIVCWGENDDGQLGDGSRNDRARPAPALLPTPAR
jgi:alpha-tubulin suppressor-like RCC1 family protein